MNGLLEVKAPEPDVDNRKMDLDVIVVMTAETDLHQLTYRCQELLAKRNVGNEFPPGHWLG
jgi:hypothetical protein